MEYQPWYSKRHGVQIVSLTRDGTTHQVNMTLEEQPRCPRIYIRTFQRKDCLESSDVQERDRLLYSKYISKTRIYEGLKLRGCHQTTYNTRKVHEAAGWSSCQLEATLL